MSLVKTIPVKNAMKYEEVKPKRVDGKAVALKYASELHTSSLIWLLIKRHKVGILAAGNVILVLNWAFPQWIELVRSLFN